MDAETVAGPLCRFGIFFVFTDTWGIPLNTEIWQHIRMDANHYQQLREKIEAEYRANLEALHRVMALEKTFSPVPTHTEQKRTIPQPVAVPAVAEIDDEIFDGVFDNAPIKKLDLTAWIEELSPELPPTFTWMTVRERLVEKHPGVAFKGASVRAAVNRLVDTGKMKIASHGAGRKPHWYMATE